MDYTEIYKKIDSPAIRPSSVNDADMECHILVPSSSTQDETSYSYFMHYIQITVKMTCIIKRPPTSTPSLIPSLSLKPSMMPNNIPSVTSSNKQIQLSSTFSMPTLSGFLSDVPSIVPFLYRRCT